MVAVVSPAPAFAPRPAPVPRPGRRASAPPLRVIDGGRSGAALARTYRRRRVVVGVVLAAALAVGGWAADAGLDVARGWAAPAPAAIDGPTVVVEADAGDTLWTIARRVRPTGDVRPAVQAMVAERGTADLQVGDEVRVPIG